MASDPEDEAIVEKELDTKSNDGLIGENEPEDNCYGDYYVDSNNIENFPHAIGSEIIISQNLQSSNNLDVPPSIVQQGATKAETEIPDFVPSEKLINTEFDWDFGFNSKEIDISEAFLQYFSPVEPDVETDSTNLKESGHLLDPRHDHTDAKQPENVDESSDCEDVDKTTIDVEFSTLSREECKKKVKTRLGRTRPVLKYSRRWSAQKETRRKAPKSQNSASQRGCSAHKRASTIVQQKQGKEEMGKSISPETASGTHYSIPSTSSKTSTARVRLLWRRDSSSSSTSLSICSSSELDPINERKRHKLLGSKSRKKQNELIDDLRIFKTRSSDNPGSVQQKKGENAETCKSMLTETGRYAQSPIPNTSTGTSAERVRMLYSEDIPSTSASSNTCNDPTIAQMIEREKKNLTGKENRRKQNKLKEKPDLETCTRRKRMLCHENNLSTSVSSRTDDNLPISQLNERERNKLAERKNRRKQIKLMEELRLLIPGVCQKSNATKIKILISAKQYIDKLKQDLERNQEMKKELKNENKSLRQKFRNLSDKSG